MIGALAYGFSYAKDPLIGVTPIEQMLAVWSREMTPAPLSHKPMRRGEFKPFLTPMEWMKKWMAPRSSGDDSPTLKSDSLRNTPQYDYLRGTRIEPMRTPVVLSGIDGLAETALSGLFNERGMTTVRAIGGGGAADENAEVEPGSVLGMEYIRGDFTAFAYGTVTHVDGDRFLAFGHPMNGQGRTYLPVSNGLIHFIVGSNERSFKYASPIKPIGTMVQDREPAIAGIITKNYAPFLPFTLKLESKGATHTYNFELLRHADLTDFLLFTAVEAAFSAAAKEYGDYTVTSTIRVEFQNDAYAPFHKTTIQSGRAAPANATVSTILPISSILMNWYDELPIERVSMDVQFEEARSIAVIDSARITKESVRPGESVEVAVTYRPYLDDMFVKRYTVKIPTDAPEGFSLLFLGDPSSYESWEFSRARGKFQPENAQQMLELLSQPAAQNSLVLSVMSMQMGVTVGGEELPDLPLTVLNVMNTTRQRGESDLTSGSVIVEKTFDAPFVVNGSTALPFYIDSDAR